MGLDVTISRTAAKDIWPRAVPRKRVYSIEMSVSPARVMLCVSKILNYVGQTQVLQLPSSEAETLQYGMKGFHFMHETRPP